MNPVALIPKLFVPDIIVEPQKDSSSSYKIILKETSKQTKTEQVIIQNLPSVCKAIKLDAFILKNTFLLGKEGELTRCDYVLIVEDNEENYMIFIELKSFKPKGTKIEKQFKSSECLMKYCGLLADSFLGDNSLNSQIKFRYVVILRKNMSKRPINIKPVNWNRNSAQNYHKMPVSSKKAIILYKEFI